ncbi:MAG: hypothetical protein ACOVOS_06190, partial [Chitinophagaceae bacterium]
MKKWVSSLMALLCLQFYGYAQPLLGILSHAHNDYQHQQPFDGAYQAGFSSIEVDVHLRNGKLLVGHDAKDLNESRTLATLYLDKINSLHSSGT